MNSVHTREEIYRVYQEEIIPLMAEMHSYLEKDYREHNKDVADLFGIAANCGNSIELSDSESEKAIWLISKIKLAAYYYIVREMSAKLEDFDGRCTDQQRVSLGIEQKYEALKQKIAESLLAIKRNFGEYPKISGECLTLYQEAYQACSDIFVLIESVSARVSWIYPYSAFGVFRKPASWFFSLLVSIVIELLICWFRPEWIGQIADWFR